jgi:DNA-binding MarR family transcriptional regulator
VSTRTHPPAALDATGGDLRLAVGRVARRLRQLYTAEELTFSETSVLSRLDREGATTPTALAAAEHVRPQAMGATLSALEQRGLVRRRDDPSDGRKVQIELTPAGRQALAAKHEAVAGIVNRALAEGFTPAERRALAAAVPLLDRLAERL